MPNEGDLGNDAAELFLNEALTSKKPAGPKPTGICLSPLCGEHLVIEPIIQALAAGSVEYEEDGQIFTFDPAGVRRWCDAECRDDWEREQKMGVVRGHG